MKKGFTLLELLIVIGILAILSTILIIVINPAEMLRKARDSQRISDLNTIKTALSFYLVESGSPDLDGSSNVAVSMYDHNFTNPPTTCDNKDITRINSQAVDGNGWIPVNLASLRGGSPISAFPVDPNPKEGQRYYLYIPDNSDLTFEIVANLESTAYADQEQKDGGRFPDLYEVGTKMILTSTSGCYTNTGS